MIIAHCDICELVVRVKEDFEWYWYHLNNGDWRDTDAPWEFVKPQEKEKMQKQFYEAVDSEKSDIKRRVWIRVKNKRIGSLNSYGINKTNKSIKIGIGIYESDYRGKGIGKEALKLLIKYIFDNTDFIRIELDTYSFNIPMIKTAESIGFKLDKIEKNVREWNNKMIDRYCYHTSKTDHRH